MSAPRAPESVGLYVHLPWCVRKCPYCDFNSHALSGKIPEGEYVDALLTDLEQDVGDERPEVHTVFIGGGTPSLFSAASIATLLEGIAARVALAADAEITLEANPGTVEQQRFAGFREAGINRLSIGIQSFDDACLEAIGRIHDGAQSRHAIDTARAAGFDNLNLDLMFALPGQTVEQALADVGMALSYSPEHLSHYQLTLEPNTLFATRPPVLPDEDAAWEMQSAARARLLEAGLEPYEISAWARPGGACRHNLNYWRFGDYLGIGAGAHGKRTRSGRVERIAKQRHPAVYMDRAGGPGRIQQRRHPGAPELVFEFMLNRLRLAEGWEPGEFTAATGLEPEAIRAPLARAEARELLELRAGRWCPTELGQRFLNDLQGLFLPDSPGKKAPAGALAGGVGLP